MRRCGSSSFCAKVGCMEETAKILVGSIDLAEAKRLKSALEDRGIHLSLKSQLDECGTGKCSTKVEVYVEETEVESFKQYLAEERSKLLEGLPFDASLLDQVYDAEKESAQCPACGTQFSTSLQECPDCGLGFGPLGAP